MNRRDLFKFAGGGVAAFLVGKYGPPQLETVRVTFGSQQRVRVEWLPFHPHLSPEQVHALRNGNALVG